MAPVHYQRGRGAVSNRSGRFEPYERLAFDDGWGSLDEAPAAITTVIRPEATQKIITENRSPDLPFDRSINPYKGCEHGCVYCFARPTHAYLGLSAGLDFESQIVSKPEAPERLAEQLRARGYVPEAILLGANTDPYQPAERALEITRRILEVFIEFSHPVSIITKSNLILRDLDLIGALAERNLCSVTLSVTSIDRTLSRRMEPRAPTPQRRIDAIRALAEAGVPTGVSASPMIPGLNDAELESILEACRAAGARYAGYILVRLPLEIKDLFGEWLDAHYPLRKEKVLGLIRDAHDGELYRAEWGTRMRGSGPYADMLRRRFKAARDRLGYEAKMAPLDFEQFEVPPAAGDQMDLFGTK